MEAPAPELWLFQELGWNYRMTNLQAWPESLELCQAKAKTMIW
jgi:dTDP-4-amino-4,6-dideoxygalactose transaminase